MSQDKMEKLVFNSGLGHGKVRFTVNSLAGKNVCLQLGGDDDCVTAHMNPKDTITLGQVLMTHGVTALIGDKEDIKND